ncbi:MAG: thioredoxin domain-containing protein [Gammaproteobacteria bacterium]|nr:thioredoxin domain-containing protein [Gammaproteobacteria bacterium]
MALLAAWLGGSISKARGVVGRSLMGQPRLDVTVFMDYVCPFCYVGAVRLERLRDTYDLRVHWALVELHPETPAQGRLLAALGYPPEQWRRMMRHLEAMAETEGLSFVPREKTVNSRCALLLAEAAKEADREVFYALHWRLFEAYFAEGRDIGDETVLRELARTAGVPQATVSAAWREPRYARRLARNLAIAGAWGVSGTPTYLFNRRKLAGAVPTETLREAAAEIAE